jgi:hypothetical protein
MNLDGSRRQRFGVIVAEMKERLGLVCAASLIASACQNIPGPLATPVQRQALENFRPYKISAIVDMSDEDAPAHFVQDLTSNATSAWRWTGKRPTLRVRMRSAENLRYTIDFAVGGAMLRNTGPLTISFLVNDHVLDRVRFDREGVHHFEKAVPAGWVTAEQETTVGAEIDKPWIPPEGGPQLGIVLMRIGLTQ